MLWFIAILISFVSIQIMIMNYNASRAQLCLYKLVENNYKEFNKELMSIRTLINDIKCAPAWGLKDIKYHNETNFRDLKAEILHNAAEFYRLRDDLKSQKESAPHSAAPPASPQKRARPRVVVLEEEAIPPPKADSKTSDKQS